jgi:tetratricopeptide (TPR) repeat protein
LSRKLNNKRGEYDACLNLGRAYFDQGNKRDAFNYYKIALQNSLNENYIEGLIGSYSNLGSYYFSIGNFIEARDNFELA